MDVLRSRDGPPADGPAGLLRWSRRARDAHQPLLRDQPQGLAFQAKHDDIPAPHKRAALLATASITGWRSVGERQITRRISPVAVCCSSASLSSRFRASSSLNRRTFSIAMTAWSAKVSAARSVCRENDPRAPRAHGDDADRQSFP